ncbi:heterokaryon incompatibility protein-domain-containing protein [Parachaetomium inaequale]|uniref:Heterokaryon incompatibility protein-domain-containing protein n=1 Tax=Parachaetomium inaequale TaxID=2588326 RepID=A0AAN6SN39_9PEZI|nr:heterokaryon incompatibility protein-domain-containing protein [Parachaetomium inaequale]
MDKLSETQVYTPFCYSLAELGAPGAEFRLLELLPSAAEDELVCRILVAEIGQPSQEFKALSYTWGNGAQTHSIAVLPKKGNAGAPKVLAITESLHTALVHLRHVRKPVWLWIDQICINQEDHAEKGEQVRLMGSIYTKAEQVLVWLGPVADGSDALMDAWQTVGQAARDYGIESYYTKERWPLLARILNNVEPSDPKTVEFHALHWFARAWFTRAWTIQEFCLCTNTLFVCGTKTVQAELVMIAIQILQYSISNLFHSVYTPANVPLPLLGEVSDEPTGRLFSCRQRRRKFDRGEPHATGDQLHALLRKLYVDHDTQAKLHRDRIYSLLGLAVDTSSLGITPDYTHPDSPAADARILTQAARAMITNPSTGRIDILCASQHPKSPALAPYLPSWVPDWRGSLRPSFYTVNEAASPHLFAACGHPVEVKPVPSPVDMDPPVLGLAGYLVDTIETVTPGDDGAWEDMSWHAGRFLAFLTQIDTLFSLAMSKPHPHTSFYPTEERRAEARWRTPTGDLYWTAAQGGMQRATAEDAGVGHKQLWEMLKFFVACERVGDAAEQSKRFEEWDWEGKVSRGEVGGDYRESMKYVVGKRPFLAGEGYLGMGPAEVQGGDVVVVFCGGRVPFVLRPSESKLGGEEVFEFVGEAYCDGVMDGEVVGRRELREFFLV